MRFCDLEQKVKESGPRKLAVVSADEIHVLQGVTKAAEDGIVAPILLGNKDEIARLAQEAKLDLSSCAIEHAKDPTEAALLAMEMVRQGQVSAVMKGRIPTPELMRIGLKNGLRKENRILTHIAGFDHPQLNRIFFVSDSGVLPFPSIEQKVQIIQNAVEAMRALGLSNPRVAILSSTEEVSEKIPVSVEAAKLKQMNEPGGVLHEFGIIDGPLDFFSAMDAHIAEMKGISGQVAGQANLLICPDVVAGNLMGKAMVYFSSGIRVGGCVIGGTVPIVLLSRGSSADDKYCSILLGLSC